MGAKSTYGVMVRVYTPNKIDVPGRVNRALEHVRRILAVSEGFPALRRALFLIPEDHDCGETFMSLRSRLYAEGLNGLVEVYSFPGYHSCEVLNRGLAELSTDTSHALIVSGKAMSYFTVPALRAVDEAFGKGAKVAGLAVDEVRNMVLTGRVQNTFAAWDIKALLGEGGFDNRTDVEEIAPIIRLIRRFGRCIAPIEVPGDVLDVHTDAASQKRHEQVMTAKLKNQWTECQLLSFGLESVLDFEFIHGAVMR